MPCCTDTGNVTATARTERSGWEDARHADDAASTGANDTRDHHRPCAQQRTGNDHARAKRQVKGAAPVVARVKGGAVLQLPGCAAPTEGRAGGVGGGERRETHKVKGEGGGRTVAVPTRKGPQTAASAKPTTKRSAGQTVRPERQAQTAPASSPQAHPSKLSRTTLQTAYTGQRGTVVAAGSHPRSHDARPRVQLRRQTQEAATTPDAEGSHDSSDRNVP